MARAKSLGCYIEQCQMYPSPRRFSTGSLGWYVNGKVPISVGEEEVLCQVTVSIQVIGSKNAAMASKAPSVPQEPRRPENGPDVPPPTPERLYEDSGGLPEAAPAEILKPKRSKKR